MVPLVGNLALVPGLSGEAPVCAQAKFVARGQYAWAQPSQFTAGENSGILFRFLLYPLCRVQGSFH